MHSLLVAASFAPRLYARSARVEGNLPSKGYGRGTPTHLPAELLNSCCTYSKQALATGRGVACPA
jgi:hypothetical protein